MSEDTAVTFRYFQMVNGGHGVNLYPFLAVASKGADVRSWDGRDNHNTYWLINEGLFNVCNLPTHLANRCSGESKTVDLNNDLDADGNTLGPTRQGQYFILGCNVVAGDDDWVANQWFKYDSNSTTTVTIRKYGGLRNGDVSYDGARN